MKKENIKFIDDYSRILCGYLPCLTRDVAIFIASQFALESSFGQSDLFRDYHNICGMRLVHHRPTTGFKVDSNLHPAYSYYISVRYCIFDYLLFLAYARVNVSMLQDVELYAKFLLSTKYCPEKDYITKIQSIYQQFKSSQNV